MNMKEHIMNKHHENENECVHCNDTFMNMRKHIMNKHHENENERCEH